MRTIYTPVDSDLLEDGAYYWCLGWYGRHKPVIVKALKAQWRDDLWIITEGNDNTDMHIFEDPTKNDGVYVKLLGPIPVPESFQ
jgi:hypothetical protein